MTLFMGIRIYAKWFVTHRRYHPILPMSGLGIAHIGLKTEPEGERGTFCMLLLL